MNPETETSSIKTDMFDNPIIRLQFINYEHGFVPESKRELSEVFTLIGYSTQTGKAARHLNHVLRHQINNGVEEPLRAVRSIAREYVSYLVTSRQSVVGYKNISRVLDSMDGQKRVSNKEISRPFWPDITKLVDLDSLLERREMPQTDEIHVYNGIDYTNPISEAVSEKIFQTMHSTRISKARRLARVAIETQTRRSVFWLEICKQSMDHYGARPIVRDAINEMRRIEYLTETPLDDHETVEVSAE